MISRVFFFGMLSNTSGSSSSSSSSSSFSKTSSSSKSSVVPVGANEFEMEFIQKVKGLIDSGNDRRICFDPDNAYRGGKPKPSQFGYMNRLKRL